MSEIMNAKAGIWSPETLNGVLRQLRALPGIKINRNDSQGTVICTGRNGKEALRGLKTPRGWMVRFDSRLITKK